MPNATPAPVRRLPRWLAALAALVVLVHLAVVAWGPYGPHRDALLYYAMGEHLRLFAMDFPPFIAIVARAFTLFGNIELLTHVPVAAAHAGIVVLGAAFARRAGGDTGAQALVAVCLATAPVFVRGGSLFQPVVFDQLWWSAALWVLATIPQRRRQPADPTTAGRAVEGGAPASHAARRWLLLGLVLGLGLLTKFTILVLGAAILLAILLTPARRTLRTRWPWLAGLLALAVGSPSLVGQLVLGWPFLQQFRDLASVQLVHVSPLAFVAEQLLLAGPIVLPATIAALVLLRRDADAGLRLVIIAALCAFALMLLARGKPYYIAPVWPAVIGIGIGRIDAWLRHATTHAAGTRRMLRTASHVTLWALVLAYGTLALPLGLPFLPPEPMARYAARLGVGVTSNTGERLTLPQDYADMLGWEDHAAAAEAAWRSLPPQERARAVILGTNYGRAGAIDWFGSAALPPAIAPVGSYWFWGPGPHPGDVTIVVGEEADSLEGQYFEDAVEFTRVRRPWGVPEERDVPVVIARRPLRTLQEVWPAFRGVN